jgi:hypothetical protein
VVNPKDANQLTLVGVGTLYRFSTNAQGFDQNAFWKGFDQPNSDLLARTNLVRVIDGVVHLTFTLYDVAGYRITNSFTNVFNVLSNRSILVTNKTGIPLELNLNTSSFWDSELPALVEVELGILEPQAYEKLKPLLELNNKTAALEFLGRNSGKIHIFRQQVPIRLARQFQ